MLKRALYTYAFVLLVFPVFASADISSDLQAEVQALLDQVGALQKELEATQAINAPPLPTPAPTSLPTLSAAACVSLPRVLSSGAQGEDVSSLQRFLAADASIYPEGKVTGFFGPLTQAAVQRFQAKYAIVSSGSPASNGYGIVGPRTRALIAERSCTGTGIPEIDVSSGSSRCAIIASKNSVRSGEAVTVSWNSANASYAIDNTTGAHVELKGSATYYPTADTTYAYSFFGFTPSIPAVCTTRVFLEKPTIFTPQPSAVSFTADTLIAAPAEGSAPLNVNFTFHPKAGIPCATRNLTLEYGDTISTILNTNVCASSAVRVAFHAYRANGTYKARVFDNTACNGNSRCSSSPDIASTVITVSGFSACSAGDATIAHGTSGDFYNVSTVLAGDSCGAHKEVRICTDGVLSGDASYQHSSCTSITSAPVSTSCTLDGVTVSHASSRAFYSVSSTDAGQSCASIYRTCTNGTLSGSSVYNKASCTVVTPSCTLDSLTLPHGSSTLFYFARNVPANEQCVSYGQTRTCLSGTLTGAAAYKYASCAPVATGSCALDNIVLLSGSSTAFFKYANAPAGELCSAYTLSRTCSNGSLSGDSAYVYSSCSNTVPCTLDGITLGHSSSTTFYKERTAAFGSTCASVSLSRTCTNGKLSGDDAYQYGSCSVNAPSASLRQNLANALSALEYAVNAILRLLK